MPLTNGRITYTRFEVVSSPSTPTMIDSAFIDLLNEHGFQEAQIGTPDEVEVGFVTVNHLLDTTFNAEKIAFSGAALFAIRIDTHKVPAEIKKAYQKMNEQGAADGNPSGFASKAQKLEARDLAARQMQEDLAKGKYRKSKSVQVAWRFGHREIYLASTSGTDIEQFIRLMRRAFAVELRISTPGTLAQDILGRECEDLLPSPFTMPPAFGDQPDDQATARERSTPICPWVARSFDLKDFLGSEFLLWLWYHCETSEGIIELDGGKELFLTITRTLDMACAWEVGGKQTLRCDKPTSLAEAHDALVTGKWPMKIGLVVADGDDQFDLTLCGQTLNASAVRLPDIEEAQTPRDVITERLSLIYKLNFMIVAAYQTFLHERAEDGIWKQSTKAISSWIRNRR